MPNGPALHLSSSASCLWRVQRMKPGLGYGRDVPVCHSNRQERELEPSNMSPRDGSSP